MLNWFLENAAGDVASKGNITFTAYKRASCDQRIPE